MNDRFLWKTAKKKSIELDWIKISEFFSMCESGVVNNT